MSTIIGRNAKVAVSDDGITYTDIGKVTSASISFSTDMADETNNDSGGYKEEQPADSQAVIDFSGKYDSANAGQAALIAAAFSKLKKYWRFRPDEGVGEQQWVFQGHQPDYSGDTETGAVEDYSCTVNSSGVVTRSTQ